MIEIRQTEIFRTWELKLKDTRARAAIAARLARLSFGLAGDLEYVGDGVSELRIHHGPGYRVYFLRHGDRIVILLCGGDKGSQTRDIERAKILAKLWKDHDD
ncbi:type II toxin-antitoxin system RelE/ParE family toxin [Pararhizobium sp.]|uniref:type II toxin-antitoxin system RelE/ParE family toxin n=1 Tax=Pararhizobium sp. TaxID=1977563 RepID=UPI002716A48F|nr:type II toxin-antitoxin system RelE/ParE family toxin [Pararhizobium sp.]MDO9414813.1 type II toxin-antitoxin system RelE/ParE family toxin [Pararhizobium sp.]